MLKENYFIYGRHAVIAALKNSNREIIEIFIKKTDYVLQKTIKTLYKYDDSRLSDTQKSTKKIAIFDYEVEISGSNGYFRSFTMSNQELLLQNLTYGTYLICVMEKISNFQTCYTAEISEPLPLNVTSKIDKSNKIISLKFEGGKKYIVNINGKRFTTYENQKDFNLAKGLNIIEVSTSLDCQGIHKENIYIDTKSQIYPNPSIDNLNILVSNEINFSKKGMCFVKKKLDFF